MPEENLQYTVTFKTRSEGDGAQKVLQAVRDLKKEKERLNQLEQPEKTRILAAGEYDLARAIEEAERITKKSTFTTNEDNFVKVRARQAAQALVEEMRREALAKKAAEAATSGVARANSAAARGIQNTSFQVQDLAVQLAAGTSAAQAFGQQLPQLLGGFGMWGAIAGGVVALGALVLKLTSAKEETEDFKEVAEELKETLERLRESKAEEFVDAYMHSIQMLKEQTEDLREAEVQRIDTQAKVAESQRRIQEAQDKTTASMLDYMESVLGLDVTQQRAALNQRNNQREAQAATAAATVELEKQKKTYENLLTSIADAKQEMEAAAAKRKELEDQESELIKRQRIAEAGGKQGQAGDLANQLAEVKALAALQDQILQESPKTIERLTKEGFALANQISALQETTAAQLEAINAELESKNSREKITAAIASNQRLTESITGALDDYQAQTPQQQKTVEQLRALVANGIDTGEEVVQASGALQLLLSNVKKGQEEHTGALRSAADTLTLHASEIRDIKRQLDGLKNGIR